MSSKLHTRTALVRTGTLAGTTLLAAALLVGQLATGSSDAATRAPRRTITTTLATTTPTTTPNPTPTLTTTPTTKPSGVLSQTATAAAAPAQTEAQQFSGSWTQVNDPQATNGTAVVITSGALYMTTSFAPGAYLLSVRVRSASGRIVLGSNGQQIGTASIAGGWTTVSAPVYLNPSATVGLMPLSRLDGTASQPVYVDWVSVTPTGGGYTTIANKILGSTGAPVTPRGVNRDGFQFKPLGSYFMSDNDFQAMYLWGATMVRLPLDQAYWLSSNCAYDPTFMQRVDAAVQSITSRGMIALLSLQHAGDGSSCGPSYLSAMADDNSVPFWTQVAGHYKSNPLVAFDLFNEPGNISDSIWHDGGTIGTWHAVGMQTLYNTVRATGATNLTFVSGEQTAYAINVALRLPVDGYGIVYAPHVYRSPGLGPLPESIDRVIPPVAASYPVVITEFGTISGTAAYNANAVAWAESHGIGWMAWKWYQVPSQYALLQSFWSYAPSPAGQPVRDALWKARGWTTWGK